MSLMCAKYKLFIPNGCVTSAYIIADLHVPVASKVNENWIEIR